MASRNLLGQLEFDHRGDGVHGFAERGYPRGGSGRGQYGVSVGLSQPLPQRGGGRIVVSFGGAPENAQKMFDRALQEIRRLQAEGPSADLTNRAKESAKAVHEVGSKQNGYWLGRLQSAKLLQRDPMLILGRVARIEAVTPALLQETFRKYFPMERYTVVTLLPEPKPRER